nr:RNA-directed DNA polymerase, eukaryota, reverse transcriptase zinc-binding domain protein [Tanacetum cinerariifolium]
MGEIDISTLTLKQYFRLIKEYQASGMVTDEVGGMVEKDIKDITIAKYIKYEADMKKQSRRDAQSYFQTKYNDGDVGSFHREKSRTSDYPHYLTMLRSTPITIYHLCFLISNLSNHTPKIGMNPLMWSSKMKLATKKGYVLDDVWEKCRQNQRGTTYAWHDEGHEEEELWISGIKKTDYEPPMVNVETFKVKRCSFKEGRSFISITKQLDDALPLGRANWSQFSKMIIDELGAGGSTQGAT